MDKRYQIFISSTFADLKDEREKVMRAILELKCFPAGMELFKAGSKPKFAQISSVIDECDFYILIIGARYGSMDKDGVSWTEKEYNYAINLGIPILAFVHGDSGAIHLNNADLDNKLRKKLKAFKERVEETSIVSYWKNADELKANVLSSLHDALEQEKKENKITGWVRAGSVVSGDEQARSAQLEGEIAGYKKEIKSLKADLKKKEGDCGTLEKSNQKAQLEIKNLQEKIALLQRERDELKAREQKFNDDCLALEQSYQEKVNDVAGDFERVLDKLKGINEKSPVETITIPGTDVSFRMVRVEGGTFRMGANKGDYEADSDEKPAHQVTLSDYYIGETQVTQALWQAVMGENPSDYDNDPNCPVERVSWDDCQEFIEKLNKLTGKSFRLPTEAQWEFAARGGNKSQGYKYAGGNDLGKVAWYKDNAMRETNPVAQKDANELGLYDMSGNVWEWCQDWFGDYSDAPQTDPEGPEEGSHRVSRGGSWYSDAGDCRVSYRNYNTPTYENYFFGLRLAL